MPNRHGLPKLSLMTTAILHRDNRGETYVPAEARPDGGVTEGYFKQR